MHFTSHPCHDCPHPSPIPPPHHPNMPPKSHVGIAIATAHAACLIAAASLHPLAFHQGGAVAATKPWNQMRELCQYWGSYRGSKEERVEGGTADLLATAPWCYATLCTHTHTEGWQKHTYTHAAFLCYLTHMHTHIFRSCAPWCLNQHKLQIMSLSMIIKWHNRFFQAVPVSYHWCNVTLTNTALRMWRFHDSCQTNKKDKKHFLNV